MKLLASFFLLSSKGSVNMNLIQWEIQNLVKQSGTNNPLRFVRDAVKTLSMNKLKEAMQYSIYPTKNYPVRGLPSGNPYGKILFIQDYIHAVDKDKKYVTPYEEDKKKLIEEFLFHKFKISDFIWTYAVNICPYEEFKDSKVERSPNLQEINLSRTYVKYIIQAFTPVFIFLSGAAAFKMFFDSSFLNSIGNIYYLYEIPTMPIYNVDYLDELQIKLPDTFQSTNREYKDSIKKAAYFLKKEHPECFVK